MATNEVVDKKQDKIVDTGWQELTINPNLTGYIKYRKINNRVFWRVAIQLPADENDWGGATYVGLLPSGGIISSEIRPIVALAFSLSTALGSSFGSGINHAATTITITLNGVMVVYANRDSEKGRYLNSEFSYFLD
ncbi:MAG: hypothetical protein RBR94_03815 [Bacilli bacterium]|jgi:hypothetical protein|nr:hypothetical protein [Bacilli bacterium]